MIISGEEKAGGDPRANDPRVGAGAVGKTNVL